MTILVLLALITIAATGCAELPSQKVRGTIVNQDSDRYDYYGWW